MVTAEILKYIQEAKAKSFSDGQIAQNLRTSGWSEPDIHQALNSQDSLPVPPPPSSSKSVGAHSMWDSFEHILLFISLGVMATAFALVLHTFVDKWAPGVPLNSYSSYSYDSYARSLEATLLRGYLASLIVSYPLFTFFFLRITKRTQKDPTIRTLRSRKMLIYITLIITFIIVLFNVISVIYGFLSGNVTMNSALNFLISVGVSSVIFAYYLNQVKEDRKIYA